MSGACHCAGSPPLCFVLPTATGQDLVACYSSAWVWANASDSSAVMHGGLLTTGNWLTLVERWVNLTVLTWLMQLMEKKRPNRTNKSLFGAGRWSLQWRSWHSGQKHQSHSCIKYCVRPSECRGAAFCYRCESDKDENVSLLKFLVLGRCRLALVMSFAARGGTSWDQDLNREQASTSSI